MLRCDNPHLGAEAGKAVTLQCRIVINRDKIQAGENGQWHNIYYVIALESQLLELRQFRQLD